MDWIQLLCQKRLCGGFDDEDSARTPDLRDMDRVVFSAAFRRLQDKTQVFPLPLSDYVRTRLTHSLETSCVGRSMGAIVGKEIVRRHSLSTCLAPVNFGITVAVACLAHDIGNPPFGHSGEDAIQHWFSTSDLAQSLLSKLSAREKGDFLKFEGNAKGFRILTRLQNADTKGGLQLTCATLGAFTKYPREAIASPDELVPSGTSMKKHGFFQREVEFFEEVAAVCGLRSKADTPLCWTRHPLAFLVEAADDICYRVIDFEDGFRLGRISFDEIREPLLEIVGDQRSTVRRLDKIREKPDKIAYLRGRAIDTLARQSADEFLKREVDILEGVFDNPLTEKIESAEILARIKSSSREHVYAAPSVLDIEAAGFEVLGGLLEVFVESATEVAEKGDKATSRSKKILQLLPSRYSKMEEDPYRRLLRIVDYVSGMTDSFAVTQYKKIKGTSLTTI